MRRSPSPLPFRVVGPAASGLPPAAHTRWCSDGAPSAPLATFQLAPPPPAFRAYQPAPVYQLAPTPFDGPGSEEDASGSEDDELASVAGDRAAAPDTSVGVRMRRTYTHRPATEPPPPAPAASEADERYMREAFCLGPDMQLTLAHLMDPPPGERPTFALPVLAALAIHGSPKGRLTLSEIFQAIEHRFEWYARNRDNRSWKVRAFAPSCPAVRALTWPVRPLQNSVRHNLSLNKIFRQVPRPITEVGKGQYWKLDFSDGVGNKRERKRRVKRGAAAPAAAAAWPTPLSSPALGGSSPPPGSSPARPQEGAGRPIPAYPPASDARLALLSMVHPPSSSASASPELAPMNPPASDARQALISAIRGMPSLPPLPHACDVSTDSN
jgi:hypothetical protein